MFKVNNKDAIKTPWDKDDCEMAWHKGVTCRTCWIKETSSCLMMIDCIFSNRLDLKIAEKSSFLASTFVLKETWNDLKNAAYRNSWTLDARVGRWTLDAGLWTLDSGRWTLNSGHWTLGAGRWTLDSGHWTLDSGRWTLDAGRWTLDAGR